MSYDSANKAAKQNQILELLKEDLDSAKKNLVMDHKFSDELETDLENAIIQIQTRYLEGRI